MEEILKRIKAYRKERGLSQSDLSKKLNISQTAYAKIEAGKTTSISLEVCKKLAKALQVDFGSLFEIEINDNAVLLKELQEENARLKQDLENYRTLIEMMKERNMIISPRKKKSGENNYVPVGDAELREYVENYEKEEKKIIEEIKTNTLIRNLLEDGSLKDGKYYEVWKEHFKK